MADQGNDKDKITLDNPSQLNEDISAQQFSDVDCEKPDDIGQSASTPQLERKLKSRHLQMIAVGAFSMIPIQAVQDMLTISGGAVGTGLFISTGGMGPYFFQRSRF